MTDQRVVGGVVEHLVGVGLQLLDKQGVLVVVGFSIGQDFNALPKSERRRGCRVNTVDTAPTSGGVETHLEGVSGHSVILVATGPGLAPPSRPV